ncbi:MAG: UDP-N-acetylmuramate--L-alanine ligase, partial [Endomicrobiia bacterium]
GSDLVRTEITEHLEKLGARIVYKHKKENVSGADVVVVSTAISSNNPEVVMAHKNKIPVIPRAEMLAELARIKYAVTIAGTHGKTTTTSLTAMILQYGGLDPTVIIGGRVKNFGDSSAKLGKGDFLVAEADESDGSFLKLSPTIAVATNIDNDHLDYYGNIEKLKQAFVEHLNKVPFYGCSILCIDDIGIRSILKKIKRKYYTYGFNPEADFSAKIIETNFSGSKFKVFYKNKTVGDFVLSIPGIHNIQNALSAICCGIELSIPVKKIYSALKDFSGVKRRLEIKGKINNVIFIDDYGHHPAEIMATLKTIKDNFSDRRLLVIFQPHRYTRTKILYKEFGPVFRKADIVRLCEIYPAGEKPIKGVSSELILKEIKKYHNNVEMFEFNKFPKLLKPNDVVLTLGAGDIWKTGEKIIQSLKK